MRLSDRQEGFPTSARTVALAIVAIFGLVACAEENTQMQKKGKPGAGAERNSGIEDDTNNGSARNMTSDQRLERCGVDKGKLRSPNEELFKSELVGVPKYFSGSDGVLIITTVNYRVEVAPRISARVTSGGFAVQTDIVVKAEPSVAQPEAEKKAGDMRGTSQSTAFTLDERIKLSEDANGDWDGILCTIQSAREINVQRGAGSVRVKFSPALPENISPLADSAAYADEIGNGRAFRNIEAEVVSGGGTLSPGQKIVGTVTVARINPVLILQDATGKSETIRGDYAYTFTYDFGTSEQLRALGLQPQQTYFIDSKSNEFKAVVIDSGDTQLGEFVFKPR